MSNKLLSGCPEKEKFNKFIDVANEKFGMNDVSFNFPRLILFLFYNLDKVQIEECLNGLGSNDHGLDAMVPDHENKKCYLIQFKSRKSYNENENKNAKKEWSDSLESVSRKFTSNCFTPTNKKLKEIYELLNNEYRDYDLVKKIYHMGHTSTEVENNNNNCEYIGLKDILDKFVSFYEIDNDESPEEVVFTINIDKAQGTEYNNKNEMIYFTPKARNGKSRKSLVFPINGRQIVDMIEKGSTILDRNVRGYLSQNNTVNKGIIDTALKTPEHFYFFNNGISITCDQITVSSSSAKDRDRKIILKKPQVINGAQTVNSLKVAFDRKVKELKKNKLSHTEAELKAKEYMDNIVVLCKIMESNKNSETAFAKDLTIFNNTQNKIKPTDFYSNKIEQKTLKESLEKYNIEYVIKRGVFLDNNFKDKDYQITINMDKLADIFISQNKLFPISKNVFVDEKEEEYKEIFGENGIRNAERVKEMAFTIYLNEYLTKNLKKIKENYNLLENLSSMKTENKESIFKKLEEDNFMKMTFSKLYVRDILDGKNVESKSILKNLSRFENSTLSFIFNNVIKNVYLKINDDEQVNAKLFFVEKMERKDYHSINNIVVSLMANVLKIYSHIIDEMLKIKNFIRHPRTKEMENLIISTLDEELSKMDEIKYLNGK